MMRSSISKLFHCFFVPPIHHATQPKATSCVPLLHTVYPYVTGLLLALIDIKYEGSGRNLLREHPILVMLFLISKFVYVVAIFIASPSLLDLKVVVCHVFGTIACELLLLLLVSPIQCFIINVSTLTLVLAIFLVCNYLLKLLNHVTAPKGEEQSHQTMNVQTGMPSTDL